LSLELHAHLAGRGFDGDLGERRRRQP